MEQRPAHQPGYVDGPCRWGPTGGISYWPMPKANTYQGINVLENQGMGVVKFVQGDTNLEITLRQRHVLIEFEGVIEISHFAKIIQEVVDACFVVLNEGV